MKSGRLLFERWCAGIRARGRRPGAALVFCLAIACLAARAVSAQFIPPPPDNAGATPTPPPRAGASRYHPCPRCGYLCDPGWHYCVACGWDMTALTGEAEEGRLQSVARAAVGVIVSDRRNRYASAFPFGGPGLYLTNARVLVGAAEFSPRVRSFSNREYMASVVGYDLPTGVGLLKVEVQGSPSIEPAPAPPSPPEQTWAVCYPVDREDDVVRYLPVSLHRGQLTAAGQTGTYLVSFENLLRTDHAIEDGCSGAPLIDSRGRLAGMILGSPEDGITYAAPIDDLRPVVEALAAGGPPVRPFFGIGLVMADERRRSKFTIDAPAPGPLVAYLIPGSPAEQAGIKPGDFLLGIGGQRVGSVREAGTRLLAAAPGAPGVTLTLGRGGGDRQVTVPPATRPDRVLLRPVDEIQETLEANLTEVPDGPGAQQGLALSGLVRGGRGEREQFRNGDLIVSVEGKPVRSFDAFDEVIRSKFKEIFAAGATSTRRFASSYVVELGIRREGRDKTTREYVNLFPDVLAPPVY